MRAKRSIRFPADPLIPVAHFSQVRCPYRGRGGIALKVVRTMGGSAWLR